VPRPPELSLVVFLDRPCIEFARLGPRVCMTGMSQVRPLSSPTDPTERRDSRRVIVLAGGALALAAFAAYAGSLAGPFVYDDESSITDNPTLRHLGQLWTVLMPPGGGATVSGRPILNLSFALNYLWGGLAVRGYHVVNILIHTLAGLTLFGLVRRTLRQPALRGRFGAATLPLACGIAAIWTLHPLQTEAVTYTVQRAESLMGLFYLLTLYFFLRSVESPTPCRWLALSIGACLLGMGTKENMVSAPMLVLLFDRAFVAGNFAEAWRRRWRFYAGLAASWLLLAALVLGNGGNRGGSAGFDIGTSWWDYALTQFPAIAHYLELSFWPHPLVFDYGTFWVAHLADIIPQACVVAGLAGGTLLALWWRPAIGFLGVLFFAVLAPTSLTPGTTQMIVEHRMYLPLAPVVVGLAIGIYLVSDRFHLAVFAALAVGLGYLTFERNTAYRSAITIWQDTVAKRPDNPIAHSSLGSVLAGAGRFDEAIVEDQAALRLRPTFVDALSNLGNALAQAGRPAEALPHLELALRLKPDHATAHLNLGVALDLLKQSSPALAHYQAALRLKPESPDAQNDLGDALSRAGRTDEGITHLEQALRLRPDYADAHFNLAAALARANRLPEAEAQFAAGLQLRPANAEAHGTWANTLLASGHLAEALAHYEVALRLEPANATFHYNYANALAAAGRLNDALTQFAAAVREKPDYAEAQDNWGSTLLLLKRNEEAIAHYEEALRLKPENPAAHNNLGLALARLGRVAEALPHFEAAVRLAPDYGQARENLAQARAQVGGDAPRN